MNDSLSAATKWTNRVTLCIEAHVQGTVIQLQQSLFVDRGGRESGGLQLGLRPAGEIELDSDYSTKGEGTHGSLLIILQHRVEQDASIFLSYFLMFEYISLTATFFSRVPLCQTESLL